jgi:hypothetical protein
LNYDTDDELAALMQRIKAGPPLGYPVDVPGRILKPFYVLDVDKPDPKCVILQIRTGKDGMQRGQLFLPDWNEIKATVDGTHEMDIAIALADDYAWEMGYYGISIDIESSQMWNPGWGKLEKGGPINDE